MNLPSRTIPGLSLWDYLRTRLPGTFQDQASRTFRRLSNQDPSRTSQDLTPREPAKNLCANFSETHCKKHLSVQ